MNYRRANSDPLPKLIAPMLENGNTLIDNLLSETWRQLKIPTQLARAGITKRSGHEAGVLVYLHLLWRWMDCSSIGFSAGSRCGSFTRPTTVPFTIF